MIIVIDGPAGSGKSSTAEAVAEKMNLQYLDSGALYRAVTVVYLQSGSDNNKFFEILNQREISFEYAGSVFRVYLDGSDITQQIREPGVSDYVSDVAAMPEVRSYVNRLMKKAVQHGRYIADGRDLGTAVFPDADLKIYMSAELEERARRRYAELNRKGRNVSMNEVIKNLEKRDQKDTQRPDDPLKKADDAVVIDTTALSFEQQVEQICSVIRERLETKF